MNAPYHPIQTMGDVITMISQSKLPERRRRDLHSAIRRVCDILGCTPASARIEVPALRKALDGVRPAAHGITPRTFSNLRSLFAAGLKLAGLAESIDRGAAKRDAAWAPLVDAIARDKRLSTGLASFMNWCAEKGIATTISLAAPLRVAVIPPPSLNCGPSFAARGNFHDPQKTRRHLRPLLLREPARCLDRRPDPQLHNLH